MPVYTPQTPLARARIARGLTQQQCARVLGLAQSAYSAIERGRTTPDVRQAQTIAAYLRCKVADLWPITTRVTVEVPE